MLRGDIGREVHLGFFGKNPHRAQVGEFGQHRGADFLVTLADEVVDEPADQSVVEKLVFGAADSHA